MQYTLVSYSHKTSHLSILKSKFAPDTLVQERENGEKCFRSIIFIHRLFESNATPCHAQLCLDGNLEVDRLLRVRDDHLVAVCRLYSAESDGMNLGGHWNRNGVVRVSICAIVIHLESPRQCRFRFIP